jgi:hypothetical protein
MRNYFKKITNIFLVGLFSGFLVVGVCGQNMFRKMMDFDGDGKADFVITRDIGGAKYWYLWQSANGFAVRHWGLENDQAIPGDYDGDGKYDFAIFRREIVPGNSQNPKFWVLGSQSGETSFIYYPSNVWPSYAIPQDYDGDGKTDYARTVESDNSRLAFLPSGGRGNFATVFAGTGDHWIKIGDLTGDGKAEVAFFKPGDNRVSFFNADGTPGTSIQFGLAGDQFVAADFDGDGRGDLTIFRPSDGTWWWMRSSDNVINAHTFGASGDVPVAADYDGDGKTDLAIWRPGAQSEYWVYGSQTGVFVLPWGVANDTVVHY